MFEAHEHLGQVYDTEIAPAIIRRRDGMRFAPHQAASAFVVCGQEGAPVDDLATKTATSIVHAGGEPVTISMNRLREVYDRHVDPMQNVTCDEATRHWSGRLMDDAAARRLDVVIAVPSNPHFGPGDAVAELTRRGYVTGVIAAAVGSEVSTQALRVRALSGDQAAQHAQADHDASLARLSRDVDRLDRDPRVRTMRVVDGANRSVVNAGPERHAANDYRAAHTLRRAQMSPLSPSPFRRPPAAEPRQR